MKSLLILILLLSTQPLWAQERESRSLAPFTRVAFEGRGDLYLSQGLETTAEVEVSDDGALEKVKTWVSGNTLHIRYKKNEDRILPLEPKIIVYLTYRQLEAVQVAGVINVQTEGPVSGRSFALSVEGMGKNYVEVDVDNLEIECAGTANISLSGIADTQQISLDGTGTIDAFELKSNRTTAEVNGTGSLLVYAEESLLAEVNGFGAEVRYRGDPKKKVINKSGFVRVRKENF